jgi:hypothetical protein
MCLLDRLKIMNYTGKLYGKGHGKTYFPLILTSEDVDGMQEENLHLKAMLTNLSENHATDMQRLSAMIDFRDNAIRKLRDAKGRHHSELATRALFEILGHNVIAHPRGEEKA